jgi:hypothetical protein
MDSFGVVEDQVLGKLCIEKLFIRRKAMFAFTFKSMD